MAAISAPVKSTKRSRLQFSHAIGPTKLKSAGSFSCSIPDPQKLPLVCNAQLYRGMSPCSKLTCESARQLSKAYLEGRLCCYLVGQVGTYNNLFGKLVWWTWPTYTSGLISRPSLSRPRGRTEVTMCTWSS